MSAWADFFFVFLFYFKAFLNEPWRTIFLLRLDLYFFAPLIGKLLAYFADLLLMMLKLFS
jgi:hypothetical protein